MTFSHLFKETPLGPYTLKNRIVLPPLTRSRSSQPGNIPNKLMAEYYAQRAGAGFMVTEGTQIEPRGQGYAWTPGIHSAEQVNGWKQVTQAVHEAGSIIFCQLWHVGRVSHTSLQPNKAAPVSPSEIKADAVKVFIETAPEQGALAEPSKPRALSTAEVEELVQMYKAAAINAKEAGFDGVELHCANGYLVNQFISEHTNNRTDKYGGSLENRLRFLKEITQAVAQVMGADKVGVRFAPLFSSTDEERVYLGLVESDPHVTYIEAIKILNNICNKKDINYNKESIENSKIYAELISLGMDQKWALLTCASHKEQYIKEKIIYANREEKQGKVNNYKGFLYNAIKNDWKDEEQEKIKLKKAKQEKIKKNESDVLKTKQEFEEQEKIKATQEREAVESYINNLNEIEFDHLKQEFEKSKSCTVIPRQLRNYDKPLFQAAFYRYIFKKHISK